MRITGLYLSLWLTLLSGCVCSSHELRARKEVDQLGDALLELHEGVCTTEAQTFACSAYQHADLLAQQYRAVRPSWFHNILVNSGVRDRGLCYHWANDLEAHLVSLKSNTFDIHLCGARVGTFREHNAVVVTAFGQPLESGIDLDAWRHSGRLFWSRVSEDKFPWKPLDVERHL